MATRTIIVKTVPVRVQVQRTVQIKTTVTVKRVK